MAQRFLVTGGAGFIGSHLCERLLERGEVACVDNLLTGSERNLEHLRGRAGFSFARADVIQGIPDVGRVDGVFHLASLASPIHYLRHPLETLRVGAEGTWNALEYGHKFGAGLLLTSTSEVYGDPLEHPQKESYRGNVSTVGPRGCYDESKRYAEALVTAAAQRGQMVRIARIFNTYGPRMALDDGRVVPAFIASALRGAPLELFGDGSQTRSFCYVDDLVAGLLALWDKGDTKPVNLGNPREMTVKEFAEAVQATAGTALPLVYKPLPVDDPTRRRPDITRARTLLGWEPRVALEEGLARTVEYFRGRV
jgi:dTDP-glucose 4,6-dehydratase